MANKTPFEIFEALKSKYMSYLKTRDNFKLSSLNREREILIESGFLHQEPYFEHIVKYKSSGELREDILDEEFREFISFKDSLFPSYNLYTHQKQALDCSAKNKHIVVTSGTGSGKTETFLLPVIQNILNESKKWKMHNGLKVDNWKKLKDAKDMQCAYQREGEQRSAAIRAMILYPLNALVEDQLTRLRKTFDSPEARNFLKTKRNDNLIYFGRYNSGTPKAGLENKQNIKSYMINYAK